MSGKHDKKEVEKEEKQIEKETTKPRKGNGQIFTYVGGGESSPRKISFMGKLS